MAVELPDFDSGDLKGFGWGEGGECGKGCEKVAPGLARHNSLILELSTHARAGCHDVFEAAGDVLPGEIGVHHFPGGLRDASAEIAATEEFQALGGKLFRSIGDADVGRGVNGRALSANGGGDNGVFG